MAGGQPYRRFNADQINERASAKVDKVILLQKRKQDKFKYKRDLKKEALRFINALKLSGEDSLGSPAQEENCTGNKGRVEKGRT